MVDLNRSRYFPLFALAPTASLEPYGDASTFKNNYQKWVTLKVQGGAKAIALFDTLDKACDAARRFNLSGMSAITIESLEKLTAILRRLQEAQDDARIDRICWNIRPNGESDGVTTIGDALERFSAERRRP